MEADVALHTPESWGSDTRTDKMKYVYNKRKDRDTRRSSRLNQMKPSRSYDNEIVETSLTKERSTSSKVSRSRVQDDSALRYGNRVPRPEAAAKLDQRKPPVGTPAPSASGSAGSSSMGGVGGQLKPSRSPDLRGRQDTRGKAKERPPTRKPASADRKKGRTLESPKIPRRIVQKQNSLPETGSTPTTAASKPAGKKNPRAIYSTEDQLTLKPPASQSKDTCKLGDKRKASLSASSSSLPTSQGVIVEVKDGPTLLYKPSETMLSDSTMPDVVKSSTERPVKKPDTVNTAERKSPSSSSTKPSSPLTMHGPLPSDQFAFQNTVDVARRQAGIKHDDIVVGPGRGRSLLARFDADRVDPDPRVTISPFAPTLDVSDETAFSSPSVISQQKAGIRHDDIVVGPAAAHFPARQGDSNRQPVDSCVSSSPPTPSVELDMPVSSAIPRVPRTDGMPFKNVDFPISDESSLACEPSKVSGLEHGPPAGMQKALVKESEKKSRGMSPVSGIPVRLEDRSRGGSPSSLKQEELGVSTSKKCDSDSGDSRSSSSQSKTFPSDSGRWKPKEKKAGIHRMRKGKKEESLSTESGYATDQMTSWHETSADVSSLSPGSPSSGDIIIVQKTLSAASESDLESTPRYLSCNQPTPLSPQTEHSLIIEKPPLPVAESPPALPATACVVESPPLQRKSDTQIRSPKLERETRSAGSSPARHQQPFSGIKSKTGSSAPSKKSEAGGRSHPLSSIPVPVGYDHPSKRPHSKTNNTSRHQAPPEYEVSDESTVVSSSPAFHQYTSSRASPVLPPISESESSKPKLDKQLPGGLGQLSTSQNLEASKLSRPQSPEHASSSSLASEPPVQTKSTSQVKPRLHRSAEHLFGDAKLSIYSSSDNIQRLNASRGANAPGVQNGRSFQDGRQKQVPESSPIVDATCTPKRGGAGQPKGRSVALLRRESDRSCAIIRRGSDRAIPVGRHDPSVEDLKKATSLRELCQSVASLLNIDNERAAEMLSTPLSRRQDLVEGLDTDAILDYLTHHGVLDPSILVDLGGDVGTAQRNSVILKHVEDHGDTAVALFINALRQSGQLHLASSLDTEQRIKPVSGNTYFGKPRHKGEVTVRIEVEALKILAPREPPSERNVNFSLLSSPSHLAEDDGVIVKDDDEDDQVKPRSCWCFCLSRKSKSRSSRSSSRKRKKGGKYEEVKPNEVRGSPPSMEIQNTSTVSHPGVDRKNPNVKPHRTKSDQENNKTNRGANGSKYTRVSSSSPSSSPPPHSSSATPAVAEGNKKKKAHKKSKNSGKPAVPETIPEVDGLHCSPDTSGQQTSARADGSATASGSGERAGSANAPKDLRLAGSAQAAPLSARSKLSKNNSDGIIMEYDPHLELVKLRAGNDELASPTRQSGPVGFMIEQWKSSGKHFLQKSELLCHAIVEEFHTDIIKYFEQDRGTLVLDVESGGTALIVFNICMTRAQVKKLEQDSQDGSLLNQMQDLFLSKVDFSKFDIRGVRYRAVVDENQLKSVLSELS